MYRYIVIVILLLGVDISYAQYAYFGSRGKISFDRITYARARMREIMSDMDKGVGFGGGMVFMGRPGGDMGTMPESHTQKMEMYFDENRTLMMNTASEDTERRPANIRMNRSGRGDMGRVGAARPNMRKANGEKVTYQDLKKSISQIQTTIDENYILTDSLSDITWRFTEEYRTIAGHECRRVNGATRDSLYLVAYYTDQIPVSAGPALSHGLPGMILGLVIPEMHIHYWATEITYTNDAVPNDWKDKKTTEMTLDDFAKSFGRYFQRGNDRNNLRRNVLEQLIY